MGYFQSPRGPDPYSHAECPRKSICVKHSTHTHARSGVNHGCGVAGCRRPNDGLIINRIVFLGDRSAATQQLWPWCNVMAAHWKKKTTGLYTSAELRNWLFQIGLFRKLLKYRISSVHPRQSSQRRVSSNIKRRLWERG